MCSTLLILATTALTQSAPVGEPAPLRVTLEDAITRALAKNPTYETALLEVRRVQAVVRETEAAWLPTVYGSVGGTHLDGTRIESGNVILAQNELSANLTLTVPLVMARQWLSTSESKLNAEATRASAADARRTVAYAAGQAFLAVYAQKFVIEVDETALENAKGHADYASQRYAGGVGTSLDEVRARQEVATDEALVQQANAQLTAAQEALGILAGEDAPLDSLGDAMLPDPPSLQAGLNEASRRTDVVALDDRSRTADKVVRDDWSNYAPYLVATAEPFYQNPAIPSLPLSGYSLSVLLTIPFYDGGLRYGQHREHQTLLDEAKVAYAAGVRQAQSDVRAAFEGVLRADEALRSFLAADKLASRALGLANTAYQAGAVTDLEVIDAERAARDAATQEAVAADASRQARLTMLAATGHLP